MSSNRKIKCYLFLILCLLITQPLAMAVSGVGAIVYDGGVTFRTWAPNASDVKVVGDFNGWGGTSMNRESGGYWSVDITGAGHDHNYKYVITYNGVDHYRVDARSFRLFHSNGNSIVYDQEAFDWEGDNFSTPWMNDLVLYQLHPGTYKSQDNGWVPGTFYDAISKLDHLQNMGINGIQVMPVSEFAGAHSMGYNPGMPYAVETDYGGPDGFKSFVKECHKRGMAVLLDIVHNHYGPTDNLLWQYDGWEQWGQGGIYFYNDERRITWWGDTRPDFGRVEVQDYIRDNFRMWLNDFRIDGFRWDSIYSMKYTSWGENSDGVSLVININNMIHNEYNGKFTFAEDNSMGLGFHGEWEAGETDEFGARVRWVLSQSSDADRDMGLLAGEITESSLWRIMYIESHDTVNEENGKIRSVVEFDGSDAHSYFARKKALLAASTLLTSVGIPQIFQGQEMVEYWGFRPQNALRWELADQFAGIVQAFGDLIHLRRNLWGASQGLKGTGCNVYHVDHNNKVIAYHRYDQGGVGDDTVVVMNLSNNEWQGNYSIGFPFGGTWYVAFNSDAQQYSSDFGNVGGSQVSVGGDWAEAPINLGRYSAVIYTRNEPTKPDNSVTTVNPANPQNCEDITVTYTPNDGPLSGSSSVYLHIGYNGWLGTEDYLMTQDGESWVYTYSSTTGAQVIDFVFTDPNTDIWDNNFNQNWHINIDGCGEIPSSSVTFDPAEPDGCGDIAITYDPGMGDLAIAETVYIHIGRNDWSDVIDPAPAMTKISNVWTYTHTPEIETLWLDIVFNDGAGIWDNNNSNNWRLVVDNCLSGTSSTVLFDPAEPDGCVDVTITYQPNDGVLADSTNINIHIGRNGWQDVVDPRAAMTETSNGWVYVYSPPLDTYIIDCVFTDETDWDNNSYQNWHLDVTGCDTSVPSSVTFDPVNPTGCVDVSITYQVNDGPLSAATSIYIRVARNGWRDQIDVMMTETGGVWNYVYSCPPGTTNIDLNFYGNDGNSDYNYSSNWFLMVEDCLPGTPSEVTFSPTNPVGCEPITITYIANDGPLFDATEINVSIGHNGWQDVVDPSIAMTQNGEEWTYTYNPPGGTYLLDVAFHDNRSRWDDNNSENWHHEITSCETSQLAVVSFDPAEPNSCGDITVQYNPNEGILNSATQIFIRIGKNGWADTVEPNPAMTWDGSVWTYTYEAVLDTFLVNCSFHDGNTNEDQRVWDKYTGNGWVVQVENCGSSSFLVITDPTNDIVVSAEQTTIDVAGEANSIIVGELKWHNSLNSESGTVAAATNWSISDIPLSPGYNVISVVGTNSGISLSASDAAGDPVYSDGWESFDNGGEGWGSSWELESDFNAGYFIANSEREPNLDIGDKAWGLWANNGDVSRVVRVFPRGMQTGEVFSIKFENNLIENGGSVGFALEDINGLNLFEFVFVGGQTNYIINDTISARDTGIPWSDAGFFINFVLVGTTNYEVTINDVLIEGNIYDGLALERLMVWNNSAGVELNYNVYFTDIALEGAELEGIASDNIVVYRNIPTLLLIKAITRMSGSTELTIGPNTYSSLTYDIEWCTNLIENNWYPLLINKSGNVTSGTLEMSHETEVPAIYYRSKCFD